jgi:hypothetical protein
MEGRSVKKLIGILACALISYGCAAPQIVDNCSGNSSPPIIISYQQQENMVKLQTAPNMTKVDKGKYIQFKIISNLGKDVTVEGKDQKSNWLAGGSSGSDFFVCVGDTTVKGETYEFKVRVEGIGMLDPAVRIR